MIGLHGAVVQACDCKRDGCGFDPAQGNELFLINILITGGGDKAKPGMWHSKFLVYSL